jgi:hypothetical protein
MGDDRDYSYEHQQCPRAQMRPAMCLHVSPGLATVEPNRTLLDAIPSTDRKGADAQRAGLDDAQARFGKHGDDLSEIVHPFRSRTTIR